MKTIHAKFLGAIAILSASVLLAGTNAQTAKTVPVGFISTTLTANTTTPFGVPLQDVSVFTGATTQVSTNAVTVTGVNWTPSQFSVAGTPHFVVITSGAQTGRALLVTANTATSLTVDVGDTDLTASGFSAVTGDTIDLFQGDTLGSLFGSTADVNGVLPSGLSGASSLLSADTVSIHNGTRFVPYFFNTTTGTWVMQNGGTVNQNAVVLYPDRGVLITHKGTSSVTLTLIGRVPATGLLTKLTPNINNAVAVRFPADTTLGSLNFSGPGTWIKGASVLAADTVNIWNGTRWVPYFQNTSNQWIQHQGNGSDQSAVVIPAGTAVMIGKKSGGLGATTYFSQALPYSLN